MFKISLIFSLQDEIAKREENKKETNLKHISLGFYILKTLLKRYQFQINFCL